MADASATKSKLLFNEVNTENNCLSLIYTHIHICICVCLLFDINLFTSQIIILKIILNIQINHVL